jgi:tetratricopeptide (TPR) repeat protein
MAGVERDRLREIEGLIEQDEPERARALLQRLLAREGRDPALNMLMCRTLALLEQHEASLFYASRALEASPADPLLRCLYGRSLGAAGRVDEALAVLERVTADAPGLAAAHLGLATARYTQGEFAAAIAACAAAGDAGVINPELDELCAGAYLACGEPREARSVLEGALRRWPGHPRVLSHLCCVLNYVPGIDPREVFRWHAEYGAVLERDLPRLPPPAPPTPPWSGAEAARRLTLGLVSPDLRVHSIAWFLEPLLEALDRREFRVACYHVGLVTDAVSERLKKLSELWRHVPRLGPTALANMIRADGVDIAIDLAGHTDGHRLAALHMRPARTQLTWLGYPNTTGVRAFDARLVDSLTDPAGSESLATERLARLDPCFLCYRAPSDAPVPRMPGGAGIVFGSFSAMSKINDPCAALWARVLERVAGSRLVLKNRSLSAAGVRERVRARLGAAGIPPDRLDLRPWSGSTHDHLSMYGDIHVALDTWPYGGTTTTCEALWMGVPVVTRTGSSHASRVGASLLGAVGLADCVAPDEARYAAIASELASDAARLAGLRAGLRRQVAASPLCDATGYARRFGAALREAWVAPRT